MIYRAAAYAWPVRDAVQRIPTPFDVALELKELGVDPPTLAAAMLGAPACEAILSLEKIEQEFGASVAALVKSVRWTHTFREGDFVLKGNVDGADQSERLRRMVLAMVQDVRAVLVKLAYVLVRLKNLSQINYDDRHAIARETFELYAPLANRLGVGQLKWQMEDLAFRALDPRAYTRVAKSLEERRAEREMFVDELVESLDAELKTAGIKNIRVFGRAKHIYSIWKKMQRKHIEFGEVFDIRAVRVLVNSVSDCYAVLGLVHGNWRHIPKEFDDYVANPKENGYQSLHTAVVGPGGKVVEVQIRTRQMDDDAELGVAAHWRYKEGGALDDSLQQSINTLRQLLENPSEEGALLDSVSSDFFSDRVFVLSPKGTVIDLPQGSTPLDFAYQIHTHVGHRCRGAKVNGAIANLTHKLQNGDQVEILTTREPRPSRDWLNKDLGYIKTSRARAKVRAWFNIQDHDQHVEDGRAILDRECKRLNASSIGHDKLVRHFTYERADELYAAIGRNNVSLAQIAAAVHALQPPAPHETGIELRQRPSRARKGNSDEISVRGVGSLLTQISRCCKPVPYDPIVGYITRGKGVSVHRVDCTNILKLKESDRERLIEVEWGDEHQNAYPVDLRIVAYDRQGLLRDVSQTMLDQDLNITAVETRSNPKDQTATMSLTVELYDVDQLSRTLEMVRQLPNILSVERCN